MFRADLHCHSTQSDGVCSPKKLFELAASASLSGLSITDHDTLTFSPELESQANAVGIQLLSGTELSSSEPGFQESVHVLGYGYNYESEELVRHCRLIQKLRKKRNREIQRRLLTIGVDVDLERLYKSHPTGAVGRPHFASEVVAQNKASSIEEAFRLYLGDLKQCYVPMERPLVADTIRVIHQAGGYAVIAHPHLIRKKKLFEALLCHPFDAIEGRYGCMSSSRNAPFEKIAKQKHWICTAGSDFHGYKGRSKLGDSCVNEEIFYHLKKGRD